MRGMIISCVFTEGADATAQRRESEILDLRIEACVIGVGDDERAGA